MAAAAVVDVHSVFGMSQEDSRVGPQQASQLQGAAMENARKSQLLMISTSIAVSAVCICMKRYK